VAGRLDPSAASLTLGLPDGRERTLASRDGFFLGELPDERDEYRLVARDSVGTEVGRQRVNRFLADVHSRMFAKVIGAERTVIDTVDTHGRPLRLSLVPTKDATCVRITTATGTGTGCGSQLRADQGISVFLTLSGSMIYLEGSVGPEVAELELDYQDGTSAVVPIVERFVLSDIDASYFQAGKRPYRLIARDRKGNEVARQSLSQGVFGPDSGIWSGSAP
jgi:hypothetical protein